MFTDRFGIVLGTLVAASVLLLAGKRPAVSLEQPASLRLARIISLEAADERPSFALVFERLGQSFLVVPVGEHEDGNLIVHNALSLDFQGNVAGAWRWRPLPAAAVNVVVVGDGQTLLYYDDSSRELVLVTGESGRLTEVARTSLARFDLQAVNGLAYDSQARRLFVLDGVARRIVELRLQIQGPDRRQLGVEAARYRDLPTILNGMGELSAGLAFNVTDSSLYVMDSNNRRIYVLNDTGALATTLDLSPFMLVNPSLFTFAPTGDLSDDPRRMSLYIMDTVAGDQRRLVELAFVSEQDTLLKASPVEGALVQIIDSSQFDPPSPDPSGVAFLSDKGHLVVSDAEVEEMSLFEGANIFEVSTSGALNRAFGIVTFSNEPTGVAYAPQGNRLFFADDQSDIVFELAAGLDGNFGTEDDGLTWFGTRAFDSHDPEGVAYEGLANRLFITDGVNAEIYEVRAGPNGLFDGVDDQISHFDTERLGVLDPEGIEFNPDTGNLYIVGKPEEIVAEVTTTGELVAAIDISAANPRKPAGLAYGRRSDNPDEMSLYVTERGVDNDSDPDENDGKIYEFGLDISSSTATPTPAPTDTPTATPTATSTPLMTSTPAKETPTPTPPAGETLQNQMFLAFIAYNGRNVEEAVAVEHLP